VSVMVPVVDNDPRAKEGSRVIWWQDAPKFTAQPSRRSFLKSATLAVAETEVSKP
jgi:hypothetical protein